MNQHPRPTALIVEKVTVFQMGVFGSTRREAAALELEVKPDGRVFAKLRKPRARSWVGLNVERECSIVVLDGWGHPDQEQLEETPDGRGRVSRWSCYAPEWRADFDRFLAEYLSKNPRVRVFGDYRKSSASEDVGTPLASEGVGDPALTAPGSRLQASGSESEGERIHPAEFHGARVAAMLERMPDPIRGAFEA